MPDSRGNCDLPPLSLCSFDDRFRNLTTTSSHPGGEDHVTQQLTRQQIAWRVAQDLPEGSCVRLGSGMPSMVSDYVPAGRNVIFDSDHDLLDYSVLGADQVAENGDLANGDLPKGRQAPAAGAKHVLVMMEYFAKDGSARLVPKCTLPLTGKACVTTVYTDIAVLDLIAGKVWLRELIEGITLHTLQAETDVQLHVSPALKLLQGPAAG
jgi:3-oxoadipate CoA-transferase, beta subunit